MRTVLPIKAFTIVELMVTIVIVAVLGSLASSAFTNYRIRAKAAEAAGAIETMAKGEFEYYSKNTAFTDAGPTNVPPSAQKVIVDFDTDTRWRLINFGFGDPIYFGYEAITDATSVNCNAYGDLNGDGVSSIYTRTVQLDSDGQVVMGGFVIFGELE